MSARTYVAAGAALLDAHNPGWFRRINLDELNMCSVNFCVLGQLYGEYYKGLEALGVVDMEDRIGYGFSSDDDYDGLDSEWTRYIEGRLSESASVTAGNYRYTVVEAIRMGREIAENRNTEALIDLLVTASGGDRALFQAVLNPLPQPLAPWERELLDTQPPF